MCNTSTSDPAATAAAAAKGAKTPANDPEHSMNTVEHSLPDAPRVTKKAAPKANRGLVRTLTNIFAIVQVFIVCIAIVVIALKRRGNDKNPSMSSENGGTMTTPTLTSGEPTPGPTAFRPVTYVPGDLTVDQLGLRLSTGLSARIVAQYDKHVKLANGKKSDARFHRFPDAAQVYPHPAGARYGWIYVSNSEVDGPDGGVGAMTFNSDGEVVNYEMILEGSSDNCSGGPTPWGTWISCEEDEDRGQVWEVDPTGRLAPRITVLGQSGGNYESFAYDNRNPELPRFFITEDLEDGSLVRYTPSHEAIQKSETDGAAFHLLHGDGGTFEYLVLEPSSKHHGTFFWTQDRDVGRQSAKAHFQNVEGIDCRKDRCYFVSKVQHELFIIYLDDFTYTVRSTTNGLFDGEPDQLLLMLDDDNIDIDRRKLDTITTPVIYFTEDGGEHAGIHGRDLDGNYVTILEGGDGYTTESTGLAFSPDMKHMYFAFQDEGLLFDITRDDGYPFNGASVDVKFHSHP